MVLVDCDLGAANQHVLFGIDRPNPGLQALIDRKIESLEEALTPTPLPNLHLVAGTGAAVGAANITHGEKQRIMKRIRALDADVVIVDVGAGVSFNVLDFFELGTQRLLVVTPQVTSIQTAYSFLKGAVLRTLRHHAEKTSELELLEPAIASKENEKVSRLLARLREENPAFGEGVFRILGRFGAQIVGNQVTEPNQAGIFHAVSRMIHDFLGISVPILGYVGISRRIRESINQRRPMLLGNQIDENTKVFRQMAEALLLEDVSLDDLLIEEEDGDEAPKPAGRRRPKQAAALELTPAPRDAAIALSTASAPTAPAATRRAADAKRRRPRRRRRRIAGRAGRQAGRRRRRAPGRGARGRDAARDQPRARALRAQAPALRRSTGWRRCATTPWSPRCACSTSRPRASRSSAASRSRWASG